MLKKGGQGVRKRADGGDAASLLMVIQGRAAEQNATRAAEPSWGNRPKCGPDATGLGGDRRHLVRRRSVSGSKTEAAWVAAVSGGGPPRERPFSGPLACDASGIDESRFWSRTRASGLINSGWWEERSDGKARNRRAAKCGPPVSTFYMTS